MKKNKFKRDVIDITRQGWTGCEEMTSSLKELRRLIFELAESTDPSKCNVTMQDFADKMFVLNWLIEDVDFVCRKKASKY